MVTDKIFVLFTIGMLVSVGISSDAFADLNYNSMKLTEINFGTDGSEDGEFDYPFGVTVDSNDYILVADTRNHRIQVFDSDYNFVFGTDGSEDGEFDYPFGVTVDSNDNILVADTGNNRIQVFDSDQNFVAAFGTLMVQILESFITLLE